MYKVISVPSENWYGKSPIFCCLINDYIYEIAKAIPVCFNAIIQVVQWFIFLLSSVNIAYDVKQI